jgi:DNA polymerase-3 subunit beta
VKLRVDRDVLADGVAWAARALPSRPSLPVLSGLMLDATGGVLTISSFDQDVSARVDIDADVATKGRTLVSGRLLADITRSLQAKPVELEVVGSHVSISCGRSSFNLPTLPVEDYPRIPDMPTTAGTVPGSLLGHAVAQVAVAAGRDDTLPTLTGIRMEVEGQHITLAATDRYRLAVREFLWSPASSSVSAQHLIPARTLADLAKSLANVDEVTVALAAGGSGEGLIGFGGNGRRTSTRLLDGDFPKYRSLLPSESACVATVDTAELIEAAKRVALVAERNMPIRLSFSGSEVVLEAGAMEEAQATEVVEARVDGDDIAIAFNPTFLLDGLAAVNSAQTMFSFTMATKPAVLTGVDTETGASRADYKYLLMPVRLTG